MLKFGATHWIFHGHLQKSKKKYPPPIVSHLPFWFQYWIQTHCLHAKAGGGITVVENYLKCLIFIKMRIKSQRFIIQNSSFKRLFSTFLTLQWCRKSIINSSSELLYEIKCKGIDYYYDARSRQAIEGCITIVMFVVSPCHSSLHAIDHDIDMPPLL